MLEEEEVSIDNKGSGKGGEGREGEGRGIDFKDRVATLRQLMIISPFNSR